MELALIRHTRCDVAEGTCYGHLDVPLAHTAAADIELALSRVPSVGVVFSSPSRRCHSLAQALAARDGCELHIRNDLRELNFGSWEGLRWEDIPRSQSDAWAADPWNQAPPSGESEQQLWARVARVAEELLRLARAKHVANREDRIAEEPTCGGEESRRPQASDRIAVVSHGGPLRHLRCAFTGAPASERWSWSSACGEVALVTPRATLGP